MIGCLCIHGFTGGLYEIDPLVSFLKEQTNWIVKSPLLPGHGVHLTLEDVSYTDWIETAEQAFLELQDQAETIYIIGFSMGGMIASYLASKYDVAKLVLLSPSRRYINLAQMGLDVGEIIRDRLAGHLQQNIIYQIHQHKRGHIPILAYVEFLKCMKFTKPALKEIYCPVFVAQGIQDGMVPYTSTHYLAEEIPVDIEVIYYSDSKHHICLGKDKDIVNQAVLHFLKRTISI